MTGPAAVKIVLGARERSELEARVRRRTISRADAMRAEIVLLAADGLNNCAIANEIGGPGRHAGDGRTHLAPGPEHDDVTGT